MSRMMILGYLSMAVGILGMFGVDLPKDFAEQVMSVLSDDVLEAFMVLYGLGTVVLRKMTDSPLAKGLRGLLFKDV